MLEFFFGQRTFVALRIKNNIDDLFRSVLGKIKDFLAVSDARAKRA